MAENSHPSVDSKVEEGKEDTLLRCLVDTEEALAPDEEQLCQLTL
jgi:hypothetical protein